MQKSFQFHNHNIDYTIKSSKRAKSIRIAVHHDGSCVVTVPKYVPSFIINKFIALKSEWIIDKIEYFSKFKGSFKTKKEKREDYLKYKEKARDIIRERIEYFNKFYNYKWNKITIKNQKTRWGSCSKKGNLNFNYKIALLPLGSADYIIVHELCHLKELNHSKNFWQLVSKTIPDYKEIRSGLRNNKFKLD